MFVSAQSVIYLALYLERTSIAYVSEPCIIIESGSVFKRSVAPREKSDISCLPWHACMYSGLFSHKLFLMSEQQQNAAIHNVIRA